MPQVPLDRGVNTDEEDCKAEMPETALLQCTQLILETVLLEAPSGQGANDVGQHSHKGTGVYQ